MKKTIPAFLAGVLTTALVSTVAVSALAISGRMTIEVDPINVQVNGEVFQPTDVNGNDVPVFAYNGTTYAPLRALAEAYGLEVGYDKETNMATVTAPSSPSAVSHGESKEPSPYVWSADEEAAYQEFKGMWRVEKGDYTSGTDLLGELYQRQDYSAYLATDLELDNIAFSTQESYAEKLALEYFDGTSSIYFTFYGNGPRSIGNVAIKQTGEVLR